MHLCMHFTWEEAKVPEGNLHRHMENILISNRKAPSSELIWTVLLSGNPLHHCMFSKLYVDMGLRKSILDSGVLVNYRTISNLLKKIVENQICDP